MTVTRVHPVRQWLLLAVVLALAAFLFWPRPVTECTLYGPSTAVDQSIFTAMGNAGSTCLR
jgi:hypothetical protein